MVLLTGDRTAVANEVATEVGIDEVFAEMLPEQKMDRVMDEIKRGHRPMVVGDGINDSLALRAGAVGVAMGAQGVNVAIGLGFTFGLIVLSGAGVLGVEAPIIAALLHNLSTFLGLGNAGRLLLFDETQQTGNTAAA